MKNAHRILTLNYTDYLIPSDMTNKELADLVATLASLSAVNSTAKDIAGKWTTVEYLDGVRITMKSHVTTEYMDTRKQAEDYLIGLELEAALPETVGDAF
jgi:hypothetical protein